MTPHEIIVQAIRFDYNPSSNAKRIVKNLREAGYEIVPNAQLDIDLPEIHRIYGKSVGTEHALYMMQQAYEKGLQDAA